MCWTACAINPGCPLRSSHKSPVETGRVFKYSSKESSSSRLAAKPKLQRQAISASPREGRRTIDRKPLSVGEALGIGGLG
jgi:hypothetical protein